MACQQEPAFGEMLALVRSECLLEERVKSLAHQLSDANLQQMPEFHQRVKVLKQLGYVAADDTVEMKVGRCNRTAEKALLMQSRCLTRCTL